MKADGAGPITRDLFQFFAELKFNNERAWFLRNKERYEARVKKPFQALVEALLPGVTRLDRAYTQAKRFRLNRDTRFSKDKSPYKTHAAAQFRHRVALDDVHAPGFYLHLEPGQCFAAAGIWMPEPKALDAIRRRVARRDPAWMALRRLPLSDEDALKRAPKGYDPKHPLIADLRRRSFITWTDFTDQAATRPDFQKRVLDAFRKSLPLVRFLNHSMGL